MIGYQDKVHGMAVDPEDNVWITATNGATTMKLSPEGKLLLTLSESGRRGHERRPHHPDGCAWTVTGFEDDRDAGGGMEQETRRR